MALLSLFFCSACSSDKRQKDEADRLNHLAYAQRYRNLDSTLYYANKALVTSKTIGYKEGMARAYENKTFYEIARMNYRSADTLLDLADSVANNDILRLDVAVFRMRLCQRRAQNKDFYFYKGRADQLIENIQDDINTMSDSDRRRYTYAKSEYGIVLAAYLFYVNLAEESSNAIVDISKDNDIILISDTAQYLGYLYNVGSGGIIQTGKPDDILFREFDYLMQCYMLAKHTGYIYWEANSLQSLSEYLVDPKNFAMIKARDDASLRYLNDYAMPDSLLAGNLALRAVDEFVRYGDPYQIAASRRTLAACYQAIGDKESELNCLLLAADDSLKLKQAPAILSSIDERLSMAYSEFDAKHLSDSCRNAYLDIQDSTRQDRQLEARADFLQHLVYGSRALLTAIIILLVLMAIIVSSLIRYRKTHKYTIGKNSLLLPLEKWTKRQEQLKEEREDEIDELEEQISALNLQIDDARRVNIEQRAKISFVQAIMPLIDRMMHSVNTLKQDNSTESLSYVAEVCDTIQQYNAALTHWIQLRKGQISLHVETFRLQDVLDIVHLSEMSFQKKGVTLDITPTDLHLKADKALTLFLVNTIADNARKFTLEGGKVSISALASTEVPGYADVSIEDTGAGMTQEQADHLFDYKVIDNSEENLNEQKSHGFGLMNCRGIIDRYKKTSNMFAQCAIKADSQEGRGTRIHFLLPMVAKMIIVLLTLCCSLSISAKKYDLASAYADTVVMCNINADYQLAIAYADSCLTTLNRQYRAFAKYDPKDTLTLYYNGAEIHWFQKGVKVDYIALRDVRNEIAVAALALHKWDLYNSNNSSYARLYTELSKDTTLNTFCVTQENTERQINIYILVLIILIVALLGIFWWFYLRIVVHHRTSRHKIFNLLKVLNVSEEEDIDSIKERKGRALSILTDKMISGCSEEMGEVALRIRTQLENEGREMEDTEENIDSLNNNLSKLRNERDKLHVSNSIIDNTLSALKHETMYYPSHIANCVSDVMGSAESAPASAEEKENKEKELKETIAFYRSLYAVLSAQCSRNRSDISYSYTPVSVTTSGDKEEEIKIVINKSLFDYMLLLFKRKNGKETPQIDYDKYDEHYALMRVVCPNLHLTAEQCTNIFTLTTEDVDFLIIRQILREIGDAANAYATGIRALLSDDGSVEFRIIIPFVH